jgi:hypothetical protein
MLEYEVCVLSGSVGKVATLAAVNVIRTFNERDNVTALVQRLVQ